ncbi:hypothetical protein MKK70_02935 [Methylobacterium sp. E-041]|jgi:hypothetical protein|uniref:hypothetical protein n=1 Tax=unclassified Methylobacterium TaxID=2615210 RepID=UPI001FB9DEF5|nr:MULTISPECIES: hypothetical protein [unclassified Methylobacterium]MCJ2104354.1 hypothetical protein [Methylobacterium sp. E-041]MCJ2110553.1 hypothetical protein [Methylobacterium sp. E-025]
MSLPTFMRVCGAQAIDLGHGVIRWDRNEIDEWIDTLRHGPSRLPTDDEILALLR